MSIAHKVRSDAGFSRLNGARVLILEDEPIIALDLVMTVEAAGGCVVGPAGTVAAAFALLEEQEVSAAILDVNLPDGELTPVARRHPRRHPNSG